MTTDFFSNFDVFPTKNMTPIQQNNALLRLLILVSIVLYLLGFDNWLYILVGGLIILSILRFNKESFSFPSTSNKCKDCWFDSNLGMINSKYELTPPIQFNHYDDSKRSYMNAKYELTPLQDTDGFNQIWRQDPSDCGYFSMVPDPLTVLDLPPDDSQQGQCNYIYRTKLPIDTFDEGQQGFAATRALAEDAYRNNTTQFRNLIGEYRDRFNRERKHNCTDMSLNRASSGGGNSA
jgi:hypothetical protein